MSDLERMKARHAMNGPVRSLSADGSVKDAVRFFIENRFSGAPVVEEDGRPVGVLTLKDVARYTDWHLEAEESRERMRELKIAGTGQAEERPGEMHLDSLRNLTVRAVMTPRIRTVTVETPMRDVMAALLEGPFHRIFVTDAKGRLEGVVSALDVIRLVAGQLKDAPPAKRTTTRRGSAH